MPLLLGLLQLAGCSRRAAGPGGNVLFGNPVDSDASDDVIVDHGSYLEDRNPRSQAPRWFAWRVSERAGPPAGSFPVSEELEDAERQAAGRGALYVIAGAVPGTGTVWRVVAAPIDKGQIKAFALIVPPDAPRPIHWRDLVRKIDEVERLTGYDFFPALPRDVQARLESARNDPAEILDR